MKKNRIGEKNVDGPAASAPGTPAAAKEVTT